MGGDRRKRATASQPLRVLMMGVALCLLLVLSPTEPRSTSRALFFAGVVGAVLLVTGLINRDWFDVAMTIGFLPGVGGGLVRRYVEPDPEWVRYLRPLSLVVLVCVVLIVALGYARSVTELDKLLFTEATSIAFFVTLGAAGAYGILQRWLDAPAVPLAFVPLFGLIVWMGAALLIRRRFT